MKIAIFSDNFYPEISGISDSIVLLGKKLQEMGHEVHYFAPHYSTDNFKRANLENIELALGKNIKVHRLFSLPFLGSPTKQARLVFPLGLSFFEFKKEGFEIIYSQSPFGVGIEALLMSKLFRIPLIGTNHTPIEEFTKYIPIFGKYISNASKKYFTWYYNHCLFISAPYQGLLDEMKKNGLAVDHRTISNPIDLVNFIPVSADKKKELKKKYDLSEKVILYSGRLASEKHVDVIINSICEVKKIFPDARLAITGLGKAEEALKGQVKKLKLDGNVIFFGMVDEGMLQELYQASDVFAIMSTAETQSLSLMKAMAVGLPVLGGDAGALPTYINDDCGFVIPVGNSEVLSEKITVLFRDQELREKLGHSGIDFVKRFSAENIAKEWENIFGEYIKKETLNQTKLSIVIPAYNEEKFIGACLTSILEEIKKNSPERDIEVIVVNNASSDKTEEIARSFPGVIVINEREKGLTKARQAGYEASSGELIANLDSDTKMTQYWIEKVFKEFEKDDSLAALSGPYIYYDLSKRWAIVVLVWYRIGQITHFLNQYIFKKGAMLQGGNFVLRKIALDKIGGFDVSIDFWGEDTDIARRISSVGRVKFTFDLPILTSARRFKKDGIIVAGWKYLINYIWINIFKKPFTKKYEELD